MKIQKVQKKKLDIVYEDEHILLINKPSGMLSQKAKETDESLVEYRLTICWIPANLRKEDLTCFRPSVCNRLDRNTSGIVAAGRSLPGLQIMSEVIKDRSLRKYYVCVVRGNVKGEARIEGWLTKMKRRIRCRSEKRRPLEVCRSGLHTDRWYLEMDIPLLEVHLITGRSHQIRAHLASIGHPIAGDPKYGDPRVNEEVKKRFGVRSQMLHAWRLVMPETISEPLSYLAGKEFTAPIPAEMKRMEEMMIKQGMLSRDLGTILVGEQAVYEGIISSVGGIREAVQKLHELADGYRAGRMKKKNSNSDKKKIK